MSTEKIKIESIEYHALSYLREQYPNLSKVAIECIAKKIVEVYPKNPVGPEATTSQAMVNFIDKKEGKSIIDPMLKAWIEFENSKSEDFTQLTEGIKHIIIDRRLIIPSKKNWLDFFYSYYEPVTKIIQETENITPSLLSGVREFKENDVLVWLTLFTELDSNAAPYKELLLYYGHKLALLETLGIMDLLHENYFTPEFMGIHGNKVKFEKLLAEIFGVKGDREMVLLREAIKKSSPYLNRASKLSVAKLFKEIKIPEFIKDRPEFEDHF